MIETFKLVFYLLSIINPHAPDRFTPHASLAQKMQISADSLVIRQKKISTFFIWNDVIKGARI